MMPELILFGVALPEWAVTALALVVWILLIGAIFRVIIFRARERLRCPVRDRMARVTFLRGPDGAIEDVVHCSLVRRSKEFTCDKACLRLARA